VVLLPLLPPLLRHSRLGDCLPGCLPCADTSRCCRVLSRAARLWGAMQQWAVFRCMHAIIGSAEAGSVGVWRFGSLDI